MSGSELFDNRPRVHTKKLNQLPMNPEQRDPEKAVGPGRFPSWLHRKLPQGGNLWKTNKILHSKRLNTVCEEAQCPNLLECWSKKTATFLVLGKECTRSCGFCDIDFSKKPHPPEEDEPQRIADSVEELGLNHVVITMVARDDLSDGGSTHVANIVAAIRERRPTAAIELLTSDFHGNQEAYDTVIASRPEVFNHNIETIRELTPRVRHTATYDRSLHLLQYVKNNRLNPELKVKSGMMVGLGETDAQVLQAIDDLHQHGCDIITIGQYLQPNRHKLLVKKFVHPETFQMYADYGHKIGVASMYCGPFVRSSYHAGEIAGG